MPLTIRCSKCNHLIYYTDSLEGIEEISDVLNEVKDCPNCGKQVKDKVDLGDIKVKPLKTSRRLRLIEATQS